MQVDMHLLVLRQIQNLFTMKRFFKNVSVRSKLCKGRYENIKMSELEFTRIRLPYGNIDVGTTVQVEDGGVLTALTVVEKNLQIFLQL